FGGLVRCCGDVAKAVDTDLQAIGRESSSAAGLSIEIDERPKAPRFSADDRDHQGKPERARANEGPRCPANPEPDRQRILHRPRVHALPGHPGSLRPGPMHMSVSRILSRRSSFSAKRES